MCDKKKKIKLKGFIVHIGFYIYMYTNYIYMYIN